MFDFFSQLDASWNIYANVFIPSPPLSFSWCVLMNSPPSSHNFRCEFFLPTLALSILIPFAFQANPEELYHALATGFFHKQKEKKNHVLDRSEVFGEIKRIWGKRDASHSNFIATLQSTFARMKRSSWPQSKHIFLKVGIFYRKKTA